MARVDEEKWNEAPYWVRYLTSEMKVCRFSFDFKWEFQRHCDIASNIIQRPNKHTQFYNDNFEM